MIETSIGRRFHATVNKLPITRLRRWSSRLLCLLNFKNPVLQSLLPTSRLFTLSQILYHKTRQSQCRSFSIFFVRPTLAVLLLPTFLVHISVNERVEIRVACGIAVFDTTCLDLIWVGIYGFFIAAEGGDDAGDSSSRGQSSIRWRLVV